MGLDKIVEIILVSIIIYGVIYVCLRYLFGPKKIGKRI